MQVQLFCVLWPARQSTDTEILLPCAADARILGPCDAMHGLQAHLGLGHEEGANDFVLEGGQRGIAACSRRGMARSAHQISIVCAGGVQMLGQATERSQPLFVSAVEQMAVASGTHREGSGVCPVPPCCTALAPQTGEPAPPAPLAPV